MKKYIAIATSLGMGYFPKAPGTAGALLGMLIMFFLNKLLTLFDFSSGIILFLDLLAIVLITLIGVKAIKKVHEIWPHDDNKIVIDEVVGVWISLLFLPLNFYYYLLAFAVFRVFDIAKPFGIKKIDEKHTDWGVMWDDILAGIYALIVMQIIIKLL